MTGVIDSQPATLFEQRGHVAVLTLNRPAKRNAFDTAMSHEIEAAIDSIEGDDTVRVGIVRATTTAGRPIFCSGYDLSGGIGDEHGGHTDRGGFAGITDRLRTKPLIAAVDGLAIGGGFEIALACDIIVASPRASFALAEVRWNLVAAAGGVTRLPRIIGRFAAMDALLTGDEISAERAYHLGLVSRLADDGDVDALAMQVAVRIAANAPLAVRLTRAAIIESETLDDDGTARVNADMIRTIASSADTKEGVRAFLEKRQPEWTGR